MCDDWLKNMDNGKLSISCIAQSASLKLNDFVSFILGKLHGFCFVLMPGNFAIE